MQVIIVNNKDKKYLWSRPHVSQTVSCVNSSKPRQIGLAKSAEKRVGRHVLRVDLGAANFYGSQLGLHVGALSLLADYYINY